MKPCKHCGVSKSLDAFYRHPKMKDGHLNVCKVCRDAYVSEYNSTHKEKRKEAANKYATKARKTEWYQERVKEWWSKPGRAMGYYLRDKAERPEAIARRNACYAKRRAAKKQAVPSWANEFFISEAYHLAQLRTMITGFQWDVDHVVPLVSDLVCGLHTHENLQVIPATMNKSKNNRFWPNMPTDN